MPDEIQNQVDGAPDQPEVIAEGETAEAPEKTYTQAEYEELRKSLTEEWKSKSDETFKKRWAKEMSKFEQETGLDRSLLKNLKPIAQQFGVTPRYLVETVLNELKSGNVQPQQSVLPPEIQEILEERKAEKEQKSVEEVKSLYKKDFGSDMDDDDLEILQEIADEEKVHLKAAYYMAVRERWAEQLSKAQKEKVVKDLEAQKKGKVVGSPTGKVTPKGQYKDIGSALKAVAEELGDDAFK